MAKLLFTFQSDVLGFEQQITALMPEPDVMKKDEEMKVLYLLHGFHGDCTDWTRHTMVENYLEDSGKKLAIIMPSGYVYYYTDMVHGVKWFTYMAEEVPLIAESYLRLTSKPENTYIAGLSMGGAGAFKCALRYPERYALAASFAGAVDPITWAEESVALHPERIKNYNNVYGEDMKARYGTENDLMYLLDTPKASGRPLPKLYQSVGTEDFLYPTNIRFRDKALSLGYDLEFSETPGAKHEWSFWNDEIKKLIDRI